MFIYLSVKEDSGPQDCRAKPDDFTVGALRYCVPGSDPAVVTQNGLCKRPAPTPRRSEQSAEKAQRSRVVQQQALYLGGLHTQKGAKSNVRLLCLLTLEVGFSKCGRRALHSPSEGGVKVCSLLCCPAEGQGWRGGGLGEAVYSAP